MHSLAVYSKPLAFNKTPSCIVKSHGLPNFLQCHTCNIPRCFTTFTNDATYRFRIVLIFFGTLPNGLLLLEYRVDQWPFAIEATNTGGTTAFLNPVFNLVI